MCLKIQLSMLPVPMQWFCIYNNSHTDKQGPDFDDLKYLKNDRNNPEKLPKNYLKI
jgi:hypothetical protein